LKSVNGGHIPSRDSSIVVTSCRSSYGHLHIGLSYARDSDVIDGSGGTLIVHVIRIDGLPAREFSGSSDPYVKVRKLSGQVKAKIVQMLCYTMFNSTIQLK